MPLYSAIKVINNTNIIPNITLGLLLKFLTYAKSPISTKSMLVRIINLVPGKYPKKESDIILINR